MDSLPHSPLSLTSLSKCKTLNQQLDSSQQSLMSTLALKNLATHSYSNLSPSPSCFKSANLERATNSLRVFKKHRSANPKYAVPRKWCQGWVSSPIEESLSCSPCLHSILGESKSSRKDHSLKRNRLMTSQSLIQTWNFQKTSSFTSNPLSSLLTLRWKGTQNSFKALKMLKARVARTSTYPSSSTNWW